MITAQNEIITAFTQEINTMGKSHHKRDATIKQHTTPHTQLKQHIMSIQNQLPTVQNELQQCRTTTQNDQCTVQQLLQEVKTLEQNHQGEVQRLLHEVATLKQMITSTQNIHNLQPPQEIQPQSYGVLKDGVYTHMANTCGPRNHPRTHSRGANHENQATNPHHMAPTDHTK